MKNRSEDEEFDGASWETYATYKEWEFTDIVGEVEVQKTLYIKYRDRAWNETDSIFDRVVIDTKKPEAAEVTLAVPDVAQYFDVDREVYSEEEYTAFNSQNDCRGVIIYRQENIIDNNENADRIYYLENHDLRKADGYQTSSIGVDGNVFFGRRAHLYRFNPSNSSFTLLFDNEWSTITESPAIGNNGTLYIDYWINDDEQVVSSINPSNGQVNWEIPFTLTDYDNIMGIYVDYHNNVCFTIQYENGDDPDTYKLYAYKDNGNSSS